MKNTLLAAAVFSVFATGNAISKEKAAPEMGSLQKQQMQTREYDSAIETVYPAVVTVVEDAGMQITTSDRAGGILTATAPAKSKNYINLFTGAGRKKVTQTVSFFIEPRPNSRTRVRLNITNGMFNGTYRGYVKHDEQTTVLEPAVYQAVFEKIDQALFVRTAGDAATPVAGSSADAHGSPAPTLAPSSSSKPSGR